MPWAAAAIAIATDAAERAAKGAELKPARVRVRVHLPVPALLRERSWWPWLLLEFYLQFWIS